MAMRNMSECECEKVEQRREEETTPSSFTATIKICECDCDCDCDCECCIERFYSDIQKHPDLLQEMEKPQFKHTLLHEAAAAGRTTLAVEIMNLMPSLGSKLNPEGLSPLHVAVIKGRADTALALAKLDNKLVRIKGKGGLTPLHYAVAATPTQSSMELIAGLLAQCPEAMAVLNNRMQSAVHVALEHRNVEAARLLVNWLLIVAKESLLSIKDTHGNTTLHVAARNCRSEELLKSLVRLVKINKANNYGETPLDVAIFHKNDVAIKMLQYNGATTLTPRGEENAPRRRTSKMVRYLLGHYGNRCAEMLTRIYYFVTKELTMDMRNTILVVAVLIATATYQGVLQPPGGVYSAEGNADRLGRLLPTRRLGDAGGLKKHPPGRMVMGTLKYSYFMPTNTLAFISSTLIIIFVLPDRAFILILQACLIFMCVSYLLGLNFISYYNDFSRVLDIVCSCIIGVAFLMKLGYYCVKAYYDEDEWLLRGIGIRISNFTAWFFVRGAKKDEDGEEMTICTRMRQQFKLISKRDD